MAKIVQGNIEEALKATGNGKFSYWITLVGGLILYTVNSETYSIAYVIPSAECDMRLDLQQKSILLTMGTLGMAISQLFWGWLSDRIGRRKLMLYSLQLCFICTLLSVAVPHFSLIAAFRFLNGVFLACASALCFAYVGEFFCDETRSTYIMIMSICIGAAIILIPCLAWMVLPLEIHLDFLAVTFTSWRLFLVMMSLPTIPSILALMISPESPKCLASTGKSDELIVVLQRIYAWNTNNPVSQYPFNKVAHISATPRTKRSGIQDLFKWRYLRKTLLVSILQGGIFATSSGLLFWYPEILKQIFQSQDEVTVCEALNSLSDHPNNLSGNISQECENGITNSVYLQNILIGGVYILGYMAISILIRRSGIRTILISFLGISGLAGLSLHWTTNDFIIDILFIAMLVLSGLCVVVVNAAVVEIYPTHLRGMAVCIAMLFGRLGSIISSAVVGYLLIWNCEVTFMMYSASLLGCAILSFLLPNRNAPENSTKSEAS